MKKGFFAAVWRWHFYAGLFVIPFILLLAVSGTAYLFKPQIDRWEEGAFLNLPAGTPVTADAQVKAALAAYPGAQFGSYRVPEAATDAALITVKEPGGSSREVFVSPQGTVMGNLDPEKRILKIDARIHGELLIGKAGSWLVELAACWAIVMVITGVYLWWPRDAKGLGGVLWPRLGSGKRVFWRDLHAVTGFWISGFVLALLLSGLPWATVWGSGFKAARTQIGQFSGTQDWTIGGQPAGGGGEHAGHGGMAGHDMAMMMTPAIPLEAIVAKARVESLAFPVLISPPIMAANTWTVKSDAQNRPLRQTIKYDATTGAITSRKTFADQLTTDKVVAYGTAWHEGALFGWVNQLIGVLTAVGLVVMVVSGFVMWRRRKPEGRLGAPPMPTMPTRMGGVVVITLLLAAFLPVLAMSLVVLAIFDQLLLPRMPRTAAWLGVA